MAETVQNKIKKSRNEGIEILRLIAIFLVIFRHVFPSVYPLMSLINVSINAITYYSVSIFIMITGFFIFNQNNSIKKTYKNYLIHIFIPFFFFVMVVLIFEKAIYGEETFLYCLTHINIIDNLKLFLYGIAKFTCTKWTALLGHSWYVFIHTTIVLLFPIGQYILKKFEKNKIIIYLIIICYLIVLFVIDMFMMKDISYYERTKLIPKATMMAFIGYVIYNDVMKKIYNIIDNSKSRIKTNILFLLGLSILFLISFAVVLYRQKHFFAISEFLYYCRYESLTMTISVSLLIMIYLTFLHLFNGEMNEKIKNIILCCSKETFYIYFLHAELIAISQTLGIYNKTFIYLNKQFLTIIQSIIYTIVIYLLSLLIVKLIRLIINTIKKLFNRSLYERFI